MLPRLLGMKSPYWWKRRLRNDGSLGYKAGPGYSTSVSSPGCGGAKPLYRVYEVKERFPGHSSNMANPEEGKSLISNLLLIESSPHRRRGIQLMDFSPLPKLTILIGRPPLVHHLTF